MSEEEDRKADRLVTCHHCSAELPSTRPCPGGQHDPDLTELNEPPADAPVRYIRLDLVITVPNDGYDYRTDISGRLERIGGRMLDDYLVTGVGTWGASGSGWVEDVEKPI